MLLRQMRCEDELWTRADIDGDNHDHCSHAGTGSPTQAPIQDEHFRALDKNLVCPEPLPLC
jgi:hypothetical protein